MKPPLCFTSPTRLRILRQAEDELLVCVKAASVWLGSAALVMIALVLAGGAASAVYWTFHGRFLVALGSLAGMVPAVGFLALFAYALTEQRLHATGAQIETQTCLLGWCLRRKPMRLADIVSMEVVDRSYDEGSNFQIEFKTAHATAYFGSGDERANADQLLSWLIVRWIH